MPETVGDYLVSRLRDPGVEQVFGYPGDGINGILAAFGKADNRPRFAQSRHEEMSAFEAVVYAKFAGRVGVCAATSGPGPSHLLNGLYDAKLDHVPVVAIVGQTARSTMAAATSRRPTCRRSPTGRRSTRSGRCPPVVLAIPGRWWCPTRPTSSGPPTCSTRGRRSRSWWARARPRRGDRGPPGRRADRSRRGEGFAGQGRPARRPALVTGAIGLLGIRPSYELMRDCDTLLIVGSNFPYTQFVPEFGQARAVQIDLDGGIIG